jgi:hypothetical protein
MFSLPIHVVQYPDVPGSFRHGQRQAVLREGKLNSLYRLGNHQTGAFKSCYLEGLTNRGPLTGSKRIPQLKKPGRPETK